MDDMRNWYASLSSQVLDLVSDYAGQELFCLEGDSVVLQCLDDPALDFKGKFSTMRVLRFQCRLQALSWVPAPAGCLQR